MSQNYKEDTLLSKRLKSIFDFIGNDIKRCRFIDVGSDHGHLTCYALKYGGFLTSVSTDIHREPANRTEEFLNLNGLEDRSSVLCTDGLDGINLCEFDVVVMAGLGGNNIIDILSRVLKSTPIDILKTVTWILQPQKSHESLREFAFDNGFNIVDEDACEDRDIYYSYMKLVYDGIKRELGCVDKFYGPVLLKKANDTNCSYEIEKYLELLDERYKIRSRGDEEVKNMLCERLGE